MASAPPAGSVLATEFEPRFTTAAWRSRIGGSTAQITNHTLTMLITAVPATSARKVGWPMADTVWTGIDDVSVPPGSHICAFYRGATARDRLLTAYFGTGLTAGDKCICIVESPDTASRLELMDRQPAGPGPHDHQLDVHLPESTYLAGGRFTSRQMLTFWTE